MKKNLLSLFFAALTFGSVAQTQRTVLYEEFTGENCGPCASTNPALNATLLSPTNASKIIAIKWQVPIPSAPTATWSLYKTNQAEIDWRYRNASVGYGYPSQSTPTNAITSGINSAPSGRIDGQHQWTFGATSDHPFYMSNTVISNAHNVPAPFSISMQRDWNYNATAVTLTITVTAASNFNASSATSLKFRTVMVERLINFSVAPGSNQEKKFEDVAIKSFPSIQAGTQLQQNWTSGQSMTFTLNCPLPSYVRKKEEIALVGFIQDDVTRAVHQAARADRAALPPDGVATIAAKVEVTCTNFITPKLTIDNTGVNAITAMTVVPYVNNVAGTPISWTGNVPAATSSLISLGQISAPTTPGVYTFSYNITNLNAPQFNISGNSTNVSFMVVGGYQTAPVAEGFSMTAFPPTGWANVNPDQGNGWSKTNQTSGYFQLPKFSAKYDFYNNPVIGDQDELYLPPTDLLGTQAPIMSFDYAYAQRTSGSMDQLEVFISDDCGQSWTNVWSNAGANLATYVPVSTPYIPTDGDFNQWATAILTLTGYNKSNILVKFVTTSDNGNNLYIDNVNLIQQSPSIPTGITKATTGVFVNVYPNPAGGIANISMNAAKASDVRISVINTLGQIVLEKGLTLSEGSNTFSFETKDLSNGIYNVVIDSNTGTVVKKLTVTK